MDRIRLEAERPEHAAAVEHFLDAAFGAGRRAKTCERLREGRAPTAGWRLPGPVDSARFLAVDLSPGALDGVAGDVRAYA